MKGTKKESKTQKPAHKYTTQTKKERTKERKTYMNTERKRQERLTGRDTWIERRIERHNEGKRPTQVDWNVSFECPIPMI